VEIAGPDIKPREGLVALVSGGLDSAVMVGLAAEAGEAIFPLYVRQGFVWENEEAAALQKFLESIRRLDRGRVHALATARFEAPEGCAGAWATDERAEPPGANTPDEAVYLPGRNVVLLTQAALLAQASRVSRIQLGILSSNPFSDATGSFFNSIEETMFEAIRWRVTIERPFESMSKTDLLKRGAKFDLGLTLSCLRPLDGAHCGNCNKCAERAKAFRNAGLRDPARFYADSTS
jgi:7-cyano-7-deazaguanine synthase